MGDSHHAAYLPESVSTPDCQTASHGLVSTARSTLRSLRRAMDRDSWKGAPTGVCGDSLWWLLGPRHVDGFPQTGDSHRAEATASSYQPHGTSEACSELCGSSIWSRLAELDVLARCYFIADTQLDKCPLVARYAAYQYHTTCSVSQRIWHSLCGHGYYQKLTGDKEERSA